MAAGTSTYMLSSEVDEKFSAENRTDTSENTAEENKHTQNLANTIIINAVIKKLNTLHHPERSSCGNWLNHRLHVDSRIMGRLYIMSFLHSLNQTDTDEITII